MTWGNSLSDKEPAPTKVIAGFKNSYKFLSNFYPVTLLWEGHHYASVEHAYQASKCAFVFDRAKFRVDITAAEAKKLGRKLPIREGWDAERIPTMRALLKLKFAHPSLRDMLIATGDAHIEESNYWGDTFWGVCKGQGQNHLGKLLMELRTELKQ